VIILLLKLLFFAFILIFSLKLLIFGGQLVATENNHGTFSVVFIFGGQVTATDNKSLFSAASEAKKAHICGASPRPAENKG
jgi:hypothetical protein